MKKFGAHLTISVLGFVLFLPFLGSAHLFDWDEINFAEAAREMLMTGNWAQVQIDFAPFWEKPPFFFWLQAISMKIFGINEFAARFPNALVGVLWLNLIYYLGKSYFGKRMGWTWVLIYLGSFTPFLYFKSGIIDPWFNLFIFTSLYCIFLTGRYESKNLKLWFIGGVLMGLAIITKGPVALIITGAATLVYWLLSGFRRKFSLIGIMVYVIGLLLIPAIWFIPETLKNGPWFIQTFLSYQLELFLHPVASHGQPWFYHPVVLLIGCFPASIFALRKFSFQRGLTAGQTEFKRWITVIFWTVLILFSMVTTKIVHYSSLCFVGLTFLAALEIHELSRNSLKRGTKWQILFLWIVSFLWGAVLIILPWLGYHEPTKAFLVPFIKDPQAVASLNLKGLWGGWEWLPGLLFMILWSWFAFRLIITGKSSGIEKVLLIQIAIIFAILAILVPKIEYHSQRSAIDFYKKHSNENALILTYKFKSYAHFYYGRKNPVQWDKEEAWELNNLLSSFEAKSIRDLNLKQLETFEEKWKYTLMHMPTSRKMYVVAMEKKAKEVEENPYFRKLYAKGGFVFFEKN